jgi:uncharacterized protein
MLERNPLLGRGWAFPPEFVKSPRYGGEAVMVEAQTDIEQSIGILLRTSLGERVLQPQYGCNMDDYIFAALSPTNIGLMRDMVFNALLYHEPRIKVESLSVSAADSTEAIEGRFVFDITYIIKGTNSRFNFVYDYYLNESLNNRI